MLTPSDLDKAGELVGSVYTQVEADMLDYLARKMLEGDIAGQRAQTALLLLAQSSTADLRAIIDSHGADIDRAVRQEVEGALKKSDADDLRKIKKGLGVELPALTTRQTATTAAGVEEILARHNLQMEQAAKDAFIAASAEAMTLTNTGAMTSEQAIHRAVRKLERDGLTIIQYQNAETGAKTVANKVDVAVRRHVRTQIAQAGARLTEQRMDEAGVEFVEVSSHTGARPSHREWEGQVYSRHGKRTVGGVTYDDFHEACHWGDVADGIYGANCRHAHGPWIPGTPRTYDKDPQHPSGLDNEEIYDLTQKQREMEREIRAIKRDLRGCEIEYGKNGSLEAQADAAKLKESLRREQAKLRAFIDETNARCKPGTSVLQRAPGREWAGDMPRVKVPTPANRKLDEVLDMASIERSRKAAGVTKANLRKAVVDALEEDGLITQSFRYLTTEQQADYLKAALGKLKQAKDALDGTAKAERGAHAASSANIAKKLGGKGLADEHVRGVADIAAGCADADARRAFMGGLDELKLDSTTARKGAHYSPSSHGLTINMEHTAQGFAHRADKAPYQTFFHEYGHFIDHRATGYGEEITQSGRVRYRLAKNASHEAGLGATAEREVRELLNGIKKREGYGSIAEAKANLTREIEELYIADKGAIGGLSDIIHGATNGSCCDSWFLPSHEKKYWKRSTGGLNNLSTETFAHFYECTMANPKALETLKKYLPETYNVFVDILKGM